MSLTRRSFFKLAGGAVAAPFALAASAQPTIAAIVEYGWTWASPIMIDSTPGLKEVVIGAVRLNKEKILSTIQNRGDEVIVELENGKNVRIVAIDPELQNQRMIAKWREKNIQKNIEDRLACSRNSDVKEYSLKKFEKAVKNENYDNDDGPLVYIHDSIQVHNRVYFPK